MPPNEASPVSNPDPETLARTHPENFSVLSRLVPKHLRADFAAVYAYCRLSDDLGDADAADQAAHDRSLRRIAAWRARLERCLAGNAGDEPFTSLAATIRRHKLTAGPFHRLLDAFERDQRQTRYHTWDELLAYCDGSAAPVGQLVLMMIGVRPPSEVPANADIYHMSNAACAALQLTNHWQDVRRDLLERDRVYYPARETGITPEMLKDWAARPNDPEARVPYIKATRKLIHRTRDLYDAAADLPRRLGPVGGPIVATLIAGGRAVLDKLEASGCDSLWKRRTLSKPGKAAIIARISLQRALGRFNTKSSA